MSGTPVEERFADRLKQIRAFRERSLSWVARKAGTHKSYVWDLEQGKVKSPGVDITRCLAAALDCDPAWLAGWSGLDPFMPPERDTAHD